ncbi:ABC transporter substrate-binding protein [Chelativorans sp.]|uniref:ABC transporter substrate-binding protein n=1 Tax=Chelativorans sp. TaxID=2203393 RepID=UPI0028121CEF|nr:ABC transporter substrate-binding protein [Chelativorans sp.]
MIADMFGKCWRGLIAGMGAFALLAVQPASAAEPAPLDPPVDVKVAYVPIMKFATAYVAEARGIFSKYGLNVTLERVKSGTEAIAFLDQGSVDVGGISIVASLWSAWDRGLDVRIIAPGALDPMTNGPTKLIVRKDLSDSGEVKSIADLKGRKIGAAGGPGSGGEFFVSKALEQADLTIRDVELINIGNADMPAAIQGKSLDAALLSSPYSDEVLNAGTGVVLAQDFTPGLMTVAFVASGKLISERPEVAERFVLALAEAARMMQGDDYLSPENIEAYVKHTASTEEALRKGAPVIYDPNIEIPVEGLADMERVHRENGRTEYDEPLDLSKAIDTTFVDKAIAAIGRQ